MNACPDCGRTIGRSSVDLVVGMHGHEVEGFVTCERHGGAQPVVAITGPGERPVIVCRACWTDVYAHASAFLLAAMPALRDHNAPTKPQVPDLGVMMAHVAAGRCWCGAGYTSGSRSPEHGERKVCAAGHSVQVHRFNGRPDQ